MKTQPGLLLLWLSLAAGLAPLSPAAPGDKPRDLDPVLVGRSNPSPPRGEIVDVAVQDGIAFCAVEGYGLAIYDLRDPARPNFLGAHEIPGSNWGRARAVALFGTYVYVAPSLTIFDVKDPSEPRLAGQVAAPWGFGDVVAIAGHYAYVTAGEPWSLQVLDLTEPEQPRPLGRIPLGQTKGRSDSARGLAVAGPYAYVTSSSGSSEDRASLHVIDIQDPSNPAYTGGYHLLRPFGGALAVSGTHAFVADHEAGLQVLEVSEAGVPRLVGSLALSGDATAVALSGNVAFVAGGHGRDAQVHAITVEDPANPRLLGSTEPLGVSGQGAWSPQVHGLATEGGHVYAAVGQSGLRALGAGDLAQLPLVGVIETGGFPWDMARHGHYAIVAEGPSGLQIIDVSDPNRTRRIGNHPTDGEAVRVALHGSLAYSVARRWDESADQDRCSLEVFDLASVASPRRLGQVQPERVRCINDLSVSGSHAYLVGGDGATNWLETVDITVPASLTSVGLLPLACPARAVVLQEAHAYLATECGLDILDVRDPANPSLAERLTELGDVWHLAVAGELLYVISATQGPGSEWTSSLSILDITNPLVPRHVGRVLEVHGKIVLGENRAYLLGGRSVVAIDLTDPTRPRLAATAPLTSQPQAGVAFDEHRLLVIEGLHGADLGPLWTTGLSVIGFNRWANPQRLRTALLPRQTNRSYGRVGVAGHMVCQTSTRSSSNNAQGILETLDLSVPEGPAIVGSAVVSEPVQDLAVQGTLAYLATGSSGLQIFDLSHPRSPTRLGGIATGWATGPLSVFGDIACVRDGGEHLSVIYVSDPAQPRVVGEYSTRSFINAVAQVESLALVLADGLHVLDLETPSSPKLLAQLPTIKDWSGIAFEGARAFLTVESWDQDDAPLELIILDLAKPAEPTELSRTEIGSAHRLETPGLTVLQGKAYVLTRDRLFYGASALEVFDVSNPVRPVRVGGNSSLAGPGHSVVAYGDRVLVAGERSLTLLNPFIPVRLGLMVQRAGSAQASLTGPPAWPVRVQRSADLATWQDWQTVTTPGDAAVELADPEVPTPPQRFYRAVVP